MPVTLLYVEGKLDSELLAKVLEGNPLVEQEGSKNSLASITRRERARARRNRRPNPTGIAYLRDRDFDYPAPELESPVEDALEWAIPLGWYWTRHEIENYLLEPAIVAAALEWSVESYVSDLSAIAADLVHYVAARATIGAIRRELPPHYELRTRPEGLKELELPPDLTETRSHEWLRGHLGDFATRLATPLSPGGVESAYRDRIASFREASLDPRRILREFPGKDLLAGLAKLRSRTGGGAGGAAGDLRAELRDWMLANPDRLLELLPEWKQLVGILRNA